MTGGGDGGGDGVASGQLERDVTSTSSSKSTAKWKRWRRLWWLSTTQLKEQAAQIQKVSAQPEAEQTCTADWLTIPKVANRDRSSIKIALLLLRLNHVASFIKNAIFRPGIALIVQDSWLRVIVVWLG